jgi:hypothetical protein
MAAIETGFAGDYVKAKEQLSALIAKETTLKYPVLSLLAYDYFTKREADDPQSTRSKSTVESELTVLLNDLSAKEMDDPLRPFGLKLSARQAALNGEYAAFSAYNNQLIEEYPQSIHELTALFDEISYQVEVQEDYSRAKELLSRMDKAYPDEELTLMAHILMGENIDLAQPKIPKAAEGIAAPLIPRKFKLYQAFPNPFNPLTRIKYDLPKDGMVSMVVYNVRGQKIAELVNSHREAGIHEVLFDGSALPSGVYFYRLSTEHYTATKRMLLIK